MTRLIIVGWLGGALVASGCKATAEAGSLTPTDISALEAIAAQDASVVLARDWDGLTARFAPNAVRMPPNAPALKGRDAIRAALDQMPPIATFDFHMVELHGDGQLAYMRSAWSIAVPLPNADTVRDAGKILTVFEKQKDGTWLTVADAWNSDLPIPD